MQWRKKTNTLLRKFESSLGKKKGEEEWYAKWRGKKKTAITSRRGERPDFTNAGEVRLSTSERPLGRK